MDDVILDVDHNGSLMFDIAAKDAIVLVEELVENMYAVSAQGTLHGELCISNLPAAELEANDNFQGCALFAHFSNPSGSS